jgi:hypothetical protein
VNLFGVDVRAIDVEGFLTAARHIFPLLRTRLVLVVRLRRPGMLLGVLFANAYAWLETNWPLRRMYALGKTARAALVAAVALPFTTSRS